MQEIFIARIKSQQDISYLLSNRKHDAFIFMSWAMDFNALFWIMACLIQIKEIQYDRNHWTIFIYVFYIVYIFILCL